MYRHNYQAFYTKNRPKNQAAFNRLSKKTAKISHIGAIGKKTAEFLTSAAPVFSSGFY